MDNFDIVNMKYSYEETIIKRHRSISIKCKNTFKFVFT